VVRMDFVMPNIMIDRARGDTSVARGHQGKQTSIQRELLTFGKEVSRQMIDPRSSSSSSSSSVAVVRMPRSAPADC
jgi:hypothetical protein